MEYVSRSRMKHPQTTLGNVYKNVPASSGSRPGKAGEIPRIAESLAGRYPGLLVEQVQS